MPVAPPDRVADVAQPIGLFYVVDGDPPPTIDVETLESRLVGIDLGQLSEVVESPVGPKDPVTGKLIKPKTLVLNLFDDVVFTGIVEHVERTSSGHALWGRLDGVELGTMTLVVNGSVVAGTVRTPGAVYTIRTAGDGTYVIRQIDESSLPPLGEPLRGPLSVPDAPPPVPPHGGVPTEPVAPDGTSTPTPTRTPVSTIPTAPLDADTDEAQPGGLFSDVEGDPPPSTDVETLASRLVGIDFGQIAQITNSPIDSKDPVTGKPTTPQTLVLNLFDDAVFTGIVEHVEPTASGHALWGSLDGVELGTMTLVVNGSVVAGTVRTPGAVYTIRTAGDGTYVIRQIEESSLPPLGEPLEDPLTPRDAPAQADDVPPDDGSVIDVMVVYTPLAKHSEGGRAAIEALTDLYVAETNQLFTNSGVNHRIRLVLREEVDYTEDGDSILDIQRLRGATDGYMDHVHELRDLYAADLVHILVGASDSGGRAYIPRGDSADSDARLGFGLTATFRETLVFTHELGHNLGLHHDRYQLGVPRTGSHYGYVNQRMFESGASESARWRTIMAYPDQCSDVGEFYCYWVQYFSNPEKTHNGDPMGVSVDNPSTGVDGPADAVGSLHERREITANYRRSSSSPTPRVGLTLSSYWLSETGGTTTVTATLHRPSSEDTTATVSASPSDAVRLSRNGVLTIPAGETVSQGSVTITGVNNGDRTGDVNVTISATAANSSSLGVIDPEPVELAIADDETRPVVTLSLSPPEIPEFEGRTLVTATLDNRSRADTTVTVSATPSNAVQRIYSKTLTIPAGQRANVGRGVRIYAYDDDDLKEARKSVTVSGTATNSQGVTGPESVTLTIIDDEAPFFAADSITYTFTAGIAGGRFLPEAAYGNGKLTYSLYLAPSNDVTFTLGPPAWVGVPSSFEAGREMSYTLTATDADGDTDTMTISITVRKGVCPNSAAVSGYSDPGIVHDCEALLVSRDALSVDQSLNWDEDLPIGEWKGVRIAAGRVVGLRLSSQGIVGTIPSELGSLANLQSLSLSENRLTGGIPKELGSLANLLSLSLSENQLTGEIPKELGSLANLQYLSLSENRLTGGIPKELGSLANLLSLSLSENQLTGEIPKELGSLANLQYLSLSENRLTGGIPKELGSLANLQSLSLSENRLTGEIPTEMGNLSNLLELYLRGNLLTGCVPDGLRDVPNNDFSRLGLPFCIEVACAEVNDGANNPGLVSDCIALLAARDVLAGTATLNWSTDTPIADWSGVVLDVTPGRVTELRLSDLGLDGKIPTELGSLANLLSLDLSDNRLTGVIPNELGDLSNLQELYLGGNGLAGCVPDELRDVQDNDLERLGLPFCSEHPCVSGGAVVDITNPGLLSDCETLLAARDTLAGTATLNWAADTPIREWNGLTVDRVQQRVTVLILGGKGLTGEIPKELGNVTNLQFLHFNNNQLTGVIPTELGNLANLQTLFLSSNQLTGEIPSELGNLVNLQELRISYNQLTGEIPSELGNLANLQTLWLGGNQLTGEIPTELGNLANLQTLWLGGNQLTGEIPTELGNLANLEWLGLFGNELTGEIPTELGNLANLEWLGLFGNELTGEIPTELGKLTGLAHLLLNHNDLEGGIPASLGNLRNLERLWLSNNRLTGCVPPRLRDVPDNDFDRLGLPFCHSSPPEAPTIGSVTSEMDSLAISWAPPLGDGFSAITAYDLRYIETSADETVDSNWTVVQDVWTTSKGPLRYALTGLAAETQYDLQVRAVNGVGDGPWSATATGTTTRGTDCTTGSAVPNAANNPGLVSDCEALLEAKSDLVGTGTLNWTADIAMAQWEGVRLSGTPGRVTRLTLPQKGLSGTIPALLGRLSMLIELDLRNNQLTGEIPEELGELTNLQELYLSGSQITGCIFKGLRDVPTNDLDQLGLPFCDVLLDGLVVSPGSLTPAFDPYRIDYVALTTTSRVTVTPANDDNATFRFLDHNQSEIPDADGSLDGHQIDLNDMVTTLSIVVTSEDGRATRTYTIAIGRVPGSPSVSEVSPGDRQLTVSWMAPSETVGADITGYDLRYIETTADETVDSNWTVVEDVWTTGGGELEYTVTGLTSDTEYDLQVRAVNAAGDGPWSVTVTGVPTTSFDCVTGGAVADAANAGLVSDCAVLIALRDTLAGSASLNWSANTPISEWDGIEEDSLEGTPPQVVRLYLGGLGLDGAVPSELSGLTELKELYLQDNDLSGPVPVELGDLSSLTHLHLQNNDLTGGIPAELGDLAVLRELRLDSNDLTGQLPPELGSLTRVTRLWVADNDLSGSIPAEIGDMANLDWLNLGRNNFSGQIPAELGNLSRMRRLYIYENDLSGPIPGALGNLSRLTHIVAQGNNLSGEIPEELGEPGEPGVDGSP